MDETVPRKMLAAVAHAGQREAVVEALGKQRHHARIAVKRAIADHLRLPVVQIEHRREAHVDAARAQLGGEDVADRGRDLGGVQNVAVPQRAELAPSPEAR